MGLKEGRHMKEQPEEQLLTEDKLMLMKRRELKYVQMKVTSEERKGEQLKKEVVSLHFNSCLNKVFNMQAIYLLSKINHFTFNRKN